MKTNSVLGESGRWSDCDCWSTPVGALLRRPVRTVRRTLLLIEADCSNEPGSVLLFQLPYESGNLL
jgi:hypothetical protein